MAGIYLIIRLEVRLNDTHRVFFEWLNFKYDDRGFFAFLKFRRLKETN